jgi:steroid delta-isomerase-like uncharacterized protein
MTADDNKAVIRQWIEARNAHDVDAAVVLWAAEMQEHVRQGFDMVTESFPDVQITVEEMIAEGDKVALRWTFSGTQQGTFREIPATGNTVNWSGIDLYTVVDGKITSSVRQADSLSVLRQLGVNLSWQGRVIL